LYLNYLERGERVHLSMDKQDPKAEKSEGSCGNECTEMHTGKVGCKLEVENSYKT
jgi:hypothetical protein